MTVNLFTHHPNEQPEPGSEPMLRRNSEPPRGVLQKNLKAFVYLGAALLVIVAALFSSSGKKTLARGSVSGQTSQPTLQDNTENNVRELKNQLKIEQQKGQQAATAAASIADSSLAASPPPRQGDADPCVSGQRCAQIQQSGAETQLTPEQQQIQMIAAKERERADNSRFASNLVYSRAAEPGKQQAQAQMTLNHEHTEGVGDRGPASSPPEIKDRETTANYKRPPEVNVDSATGRPYLVYEGSFLDTVLMNRLDGDAVGPIKVMVSDPLYSHDHQRVLIPEGTVVLGEAKKIGATGFGQQRRMAVVFHRLLMPDGYSVDLDQFQGLDQIGEEGLKDQVNNHYLQIFGTSMALGVIAGASEITQGGGTLTPSGSQALTNGTAASVSQSATIILDRFVQIPPSITIREGHRVKVYFTQDMLLPAYSNHTMSPTL